MATAFSVRFNLESVLKQMNLEVTRRAAIGCVRALNRTATSERASLSSAIAQDMGIRVATVRDGMTIEKATASTLAVRVICRGKRIPLIEFGARGKEPSRGRGRGVTYRNPGGGRNRAEHAFITTVGGQHRGVFQRVASANRRGPKPNRSQLPIKELFGPSTVKVFEKLVPLGDARRTDVLVKNLQHEIGFALQQGA